MALIQCSECGKEISDQISACPHCGYPVQKQTDENKGKIKEITSAGYYCRYHFGPYSNYIYLLQICV